MHCIASACYVLNLDHAQASLLTIPFYLFFAALLQLFIIFLSLFMMLLQLIFIIKDFHFVKLSNDMETL